MSQQQLEIQFNVYPYHTLCWNTLDNISEAFDSGVGIQGAFREENNNETSSVRATSRSQNLGGPI